MELVHGDTVDKRVRAFAQRLVRQDFLGAADDGGIRVDVHIACDHAHVVAAQKFHQAEKLFADQRFDGRRVVRRLPKAHGHEMHAQRNQAFAAACRRAQNHVVAHHKRHERLFLVRPQLNAAIGNPARERLERLFFRKVGVCVVQVVRQRAKLPRFMPFGLRCERFDDVLALECMNISHKGSPCIVSLKSRAFNSPLALPGAVFQIAATEHPCSAFGSKLPCSIDRYCLFV